MAWRNDAAELAKQANAEGKSFAGLAKFPDGTTSWVLYDKGNWVKICNDPGFGWEDVFADLGEGMCLEFGVRGGDTIRDCSALTDRTIYGFDSWQGLPHQWGENQPRGFCLAQKPVDLPKNVELVEGLFSDTLDEFLLAHAGPVAFVNVDCDVYSSSLFVLNTLRDRFVPGSYIAMSGITLHEKCIDQRRAWNKYIKDSGQAWEFKGKHHAWGEVYKCLKA